LHSGDAVNLEADVIAKYVERIMTVGRQDEASSELTMERLVQLGYK
jgi:riboflavin synthase alpha subunit